MMDQKNWEDLFEAFNEEEPFWTGYAGEEAFAKLNLYEWLECNGARPSQKMIEECAYHGYDVFPVERDSFGWMIGGIRRKLDPSGKVIMFG